MAYIHNLTAMSGRSLTRAPSSTQPDDSVAASLIARVPQLYGNKTLFRIENDATLKLENGDELKRWEPNPDVNRRVSLWKGSIVRLKVDAIVNAANTRLRGGGGVDGAIHAAAGFRMPGACGKLGNCATGHAKITPGFDLPAKHVIHAVGPIYHSYPTEVAEKLLQSAYTKALEVAVENDVRTIAFCGLSTGIYGFPRLSATRIATEAVRTFLEGPGKDSIDQAIFVAFNDPDMQGYQAVMPYVFPIPANAVVRSTSLVDEAEEHSKIETSAQSSRQVSRQGTTAVDEDKEPTETVFDVALAAGNAHSGSQKHENLQNDVGNGSEDGRAAVGRHGGPWANAQSPANVGGIEMSQVTDAGGSGAVGGDDGGGGHGRPVPPVGSVSVDGEGPAGGPKAEPGETGEKRSV